MTFVASSAGVAIDEPSLVRVQRQPDGPWQEVPGSGIEILTAADGLGRTVSVAADQRGDGAVSRIHLRWRRADPCAGVRCWAMPGSAATAICSGADCTASRAAVDGACSRPAARCDLGAGREGPGRGLCVLDGRPGRFSLWLDLRSGSQAVQLGDRTLNVAAVTPVETTPPRSAVQGLLRRRSCLRPAADRSAGRLQQLVLRLRQRLRRGRRGPRRLVDR